jgi:hypothetical protein
MRKRDQATALATPRHVITAWTQLRTPHIRLAGPDHNRLVPTLTGLTTQQRLFNGRATGPSRINLTDRRN